MGHYRIFHRASGIWYIQNRQTGHQESLRTRSKHEAVRLLNARNESVYQPSAINLQLARAYINASDPKLGSRTWQDVMDQVVAMKHGETLRRWLVAINDRKLDPLRALALLETRSEHFLKVLEKGTVSTNAYLRRLHNFALAMDWLLKPVLPQRSWPKIVHKARRAITRDEHERIVQRETNPERRLFYVLCWHLGGSQTDVARLNAEDVDWTDQTISYTRKKLEHRQGSEIKPPLIRISSEIAAVLRELPRHGPLFPKLRTVRPGDRATEFKQRCDGLNIRGVTLHSYRYAWAERARRAGFPLRFAEEALGHNSKAVHRAYARKAEVLIPSLDDWERQMADKTMVVDFNGSQPSNEAQVDTRAWTAS
jgi:integrase